MFVIIAFFSEGDDRTIVELQVDNTTFTNSLIEIWVKTQVQKLTKLLNQRRLPKLDMKS